MKHPAKAYREHLSELLVAIERCVYFLDGACNRVHWPLTGDGLAKHNKELDLFMALSSINERFAKLQDTLGAGMRHATLLAGERADTFLQTLAYFEKVGVISSVQSWQEMRAIRNLAAHEYGTDYAEIAEHFNTLHDLVPELFSVARRFCDYCANQLGIAAAESDFTKDFQRIVHDSD